MGGSKQQNPQFVLPPDVGGLRQQQISFLSDLFRGFGQGQNPFYAGYGDFGPGNALPGLLSGQTQGTGALGSAQRGLQEGVETGFNIDTSPIVQQARQSFSQDIAPAVQESLGARYGIKFGGTVADSLARAGERVGTTLNSQLLPYADAAAQRRAAMVQLPFQLQEMARGGQQQSLLQLLNALIAGPGVLGTGGQFQTPQYTPGTLGQYGPILGSLAGGAFGGPMGAALGGAVTSGYLGQQPGRG